MRRNTHFDRPGYLFVPGPFQSFTEKGFRFVRLSSNTCRCLIINYKCTTYRIGLLSEVVMFTVCNPYIPCSQPLATWLGTYTCTSVLLKLSSGHEPFHMLFCSYVNLCKHLYVYQMTRNSYSSVLWNTPCALLKL